MFAIKLIIGQQVVFHQPELYMCLYQTKGNPQGEYATFKVYRNVLSNYYEETRNIPFLYTKRAKRDYLSIKVGFTERFKRIPWPNWPFCPWAGCSKLEGGCRMARSVSATHLTGGHTRTFKWMLRRTENTSEKLCHCLFTSWRSEMDFWLMPGLNWTRQRHDRLHPGWTRRGVPSELDKTEMRDKGDVWLKYFVRFVHLIVDQNWWKA